MREEDTPSRPTARPRRIRCGIRRRAFTLLELVMVMAILCVAAAVAVPSLRGFGQGRQTTEGAAQLVALARRARTQAIAEATTYRLNVDPEAGTYWLTVWRGGAFVDPGDGFGQTFAVPDGLTLAWGGPVVGRIGYAEFRPDGRTTPATVRLTNTNGETVDIACRSPAEPFEELPNNPARVGRLAGGGATQ